MKNARLEKLILEQQKVREKIAALHERDKELDKLIRDAENISIIGLVRAEGYTLESLSELIEKLRDNPSTDDADTPDTLADGSQAELDRREEDPTQ